MCDITYSFIQEHKSEEKAVHMIKSQTLHCWYLFVGHSLHVYPMNNGHNISFQKTLALGSGVFQGVPCKGVLHEHCSLVLQPQVEQQPQRPHQPLQESRPQPKQ